MRTALAVAAVSLVACSSGPGSSGACTEIGCQDQLTATIHDANGGLPAGMHTIEVTADGTTTSCSFTIPLTTTTGIDCPVALRVQVTPKQDCVTSGSGQYQTVTCTPIPGKLDEVVVVPGKPVTVHAKQTVDGATFLDQTLMPAYQMVRPNGPTCEPVCTQASVNWVLAAP